MSDFSQVLTAVKNVADSQHVKIYVPSRGEEISFKPLTTKQQKDLIKTAADKNLNTVTFLNAVNDIINTNCITPGDILISDRSYIIALLRALTMSPTYKNKSGEYDLTKLKVNKVALPDTLRTSIVEIPDFCITCKVPTIKADTTYNNSLLKITADKKETSDTLGDIFIYEAIKYVDRITSSALNIDIVMNALSIYQQYQLLEAVPAAGYNKVVDFITHVKNFEDSLFKIDGNVVEVDIDQGFFTI